MKSILCIGESDSSARCGIQADIRTSEYFGVYCTTAVSLLIPSEGEASLEVPSKFLYDQIQYILNNHKIDAIKIGFLASLEAIEVMKEILGKINVPVVLDPDFVHLGGECKLNDEALTQLKSLFAYVTLATPNLAEAKILFGENLLVKSPCPVLIKNHLVDDEKCVDTLYYANNIKKDFVGENCHVQSDMKGLSYSLSAAITSSLTLDEDLEDAIATAKEYVICAMKRVKKMSQEAQAKITHATEA